MFGKIPHSDFLVLQNGETREREHPSVKVHLLVEGYACVPKIKDFTKDPNEEISGNQGFWAREASHLSYYTSRGRDSSYSS